MLKEFAKIVDGKLVAVAAKECPEGMKPLVRDAIIPEDNDIIIEDKGDYILQTSKEHEQKEENQDE